MGITLNCTTHGLYPLCLPLQWTYMDSLHSSCEYGYKCHVCPSLKALVWCMMSWKCKLSYSQQGIYIYWFYLSQCVRNLRNFSQISRSDLLKLYQATVYATISYLKIYVIILKHFLYLSSSNRTISCLFP